ncbi:MAG TPA: hypothetical protein VMW42_03420 [Desulfatiglandales bacterium]|nr:hypothetical protein [Desulfatiglandales bacterium]
MTGNQVTNNRKHKKLPKGLTFYRFLHTTTTNPVFFLLCIFTGPPGWLLLILGFSLANSRVNNFVGAAERHLTTGHKGRAIQFIEAALSIDQTHKKALSLKLKMLNMVPFSDWPVPSASEAETRLLEKLESSCHP